MLPLLADAANGRQAELLLKGSDDETARSKVVPWRSSRKSRLSWFCFSGDFSFWALIRYVPFFLNVLGSQANPSYGFVVWVVLFHLLVSNHFTVYLGISFTLVWL